MATKEKFGFIIAMAFSIAIIVAVFAGIGIAIVASGEATWVEYLIIIGCIPVALILYQIQQR